MFQKSHWRHLSLIGLFVSLAVFAADKTLDLPLTKNEPQQFKHMIEIRQCGLCHADKENKRLVLLDGTPVEREDSARLCGQCHGEVYSSWLKGIHGKLTGTWTEMKSRRNCVACHEPHAPKYPETKARPAPRHPKNLVRKTGEHHE